MHPLDYSSERVTQVTSMYSDGLSIYQISQLTGIPKSTIGRYVKACGKSRSRALAQRKYNKRETLVPKQWTFSEMCPHKTWVLGLIYGDGSIQKNGSAFYIVSGDYDILQKVQAIFGGNISISKEQRARNCWRVAICSTWLLTELKDLFGIDHRKVTEMRFPQLSRDLYSHFVRGLIDSDGSWGIFQRANGPVLSFTYSTVAENFAKDLKYVLDEELHISSKRKIYSSSRLPYKTLYQIKYDSSTAVRIGEWAYANSDTTMRCDRKYEFWNNNRRSIFPVRWEKGL